MFAIDGIALDNNAHGWMLMAGTNPWGGYTARRSVVTVPGRYGRVSTPWVVDPVQIGLTIHTPDTGLDVLNMLLRGASRLSRVNDPTREVEVEFVTESVNEMDAETLVVTAVLDVPYVFWRDVESMDWLSTDPVLAGGTAPVWDAVIRVPGPFTDLEIQSGQSWLSYTGTVAAGSFLRIDTGTGDAWLTSTDTWSGGTDVTGSLDHGRGYPLLLVPTFGDVISTPITVSAASGTPVATVRGRRAYAV